MDKKLGRPTLPAAEKRRNVVAIALTDGELEMLELAAAEEDRTMSYYVRRVLIAHLTNEGT